LDKLSIQESVEFEYEVTVNTHWGEREKDAKIRSKADLRGAITEAIKEFYRLNDRMGEICGWVEIRVIAMDLWFSLDDFMPKAAYIELYEQLNRDPSIRESVKLEK
jgi:hypothetical protein